MKITTKKQFYKLHQRGAFGNRALAWNTKEDLIKSKWTGQICIRGIGIPRNLTKYNIPQEELENAIETFIEKGVSIEKLRFNQSMPDEALTIQGELKTTINHIDLTYSTIKEPMNAALKKEEIHISGLNAIMLLKQNLSPSSYADLQILLEKYPTSVIEFSSYSCPVGDTKGRNTVIWEVRNY